ncbi:MAG TPA: SBBP repeat-containing protein [Chthoniobacterales bacterium]|nr:SBBP repeat-containing protein [Chthoniobacterales bacterium]
MKKHISLIKFLALSLLAVSTLAALLLFARSGKERAPQASPGEIAAAPMAARTTAQVRKAYGQLPLSFEANHGQAAESVDFVARGPGYAVALSPTEATFVLRKADNTGRNDNDSRVRKISNSTSEPNPSSALHPAPSTVLRMKLAGANRAATVAGQNELEGRVNYLIGSDPAKWRTDVPTFGRVRYAEVYPGIDVIYYGNQRRLEYDFVVGPGRDVRAIALEFAGAQKVEVDGATSDLLVQVGGETIRQHAPVAYQEVPGGGRRKIESRYVLREGGQVGFEVGEYDASAPLVIDPVLEYSTFLGGSFGDQGRDIAVDSAGNAYVVGVPSSDFPTVNAFQDTSHGIQDVFITKLNAAGSALVYSTYLGGSGYDFGLGIAVDSAGSAYVTGQTSSTDFPTANAFQGKNASGLGDDAFVAKLSPTGSALVYSTYLGGSNNDAGVDIAVDSAGNAYVTGFTSSTNFPTANGFQRIEGGFEHGDAFVTKFNGAGSALVYSTYLGGGDSDHGESIAVDSAGNAYVTGSTLSTDFPTVNAFQSTFGGGSDGESGDAFVTKFNAAGSALVYSTYLGGDNGDSGHSIAVDSAGSAYVTGGTVSADFPTANALQNAIGGSVDTFVTKLTAAGSALVYSTYLGGNDFEVGHGIAVDSTGNAYVTGNTGSTNFPTVNPFQSTIGSDLDAFVTKLNAAGSALAYSSYLGGNDLDHVFDIAVDSMGNAYVTGDTSSTCFPTTTGAFDTALGLGGGDAFITKVSETAKPSPLTPCSSELLNIATRMRVSTGDSALIGGFIIVGQPKRVIIRGIGPSLTDIPGALANPVLELFHSDGRLLLSNDDWITNREEVEETTIPPTHDLESAIVVLLPPGAYTAVLRGQNNAIGIGIVEVYDLNVGVNSTLANIGSRGFVDTGDNAMIGGFIVGGGSAPVRVLIRGIGPSLASSVPNALADPTLELRNGNGSLIRDNDNWRDSQEEEIQNTTIPPSHDLEAAIIETVPNGNYTAVLRGENNTSGVAVVEVYNLP